MTDEGGADILHSRPQVVHQLDRPNIPSQVEILRKETDLSKEQAEENPYILFFGDNVRRIYKAIPKRIWMNEVEKDENDNFVRYIRIEVPIEELKVLIAKS